MKTILAPIDFSGATSPVLEVASALARVFQAKIVLVHAIRPAVIVNEYSPMVESYATASGQSARKKLLQWKTQLQLDGFTVETNLLYGHPAVCIRGEATRLGADYIVLGSHGHGALYNLVVGEHRQRCSKEGSLSRFGRPGHEPKTRGPRLLGRVPNQTRGSGVLPRRRLNGWLEIFPSQGTS